ncbi:MAG: hypothetical protein KC482_04140 [Dehalococcoidia bacterium]|nr:hypothetical protein [Dehalococcoidia bacterium]MCA9852773.1 hypothetical protein [Dehalococcoidia bacterium]
MTSPFLLCFAVAAALFVACSSTDRGPTPLDSETNTDQQHPTTEDATLPRERLHGVQLDPLDQTTIANVLEDGTSEFQASILSDGVLTIAEYESAALSKITCLRSAGLEVKGDLHLNSIGLILVSTRFADTTREQSTAMIASCEKEYMREIQMLWAIVTKPLVVEVATEFRHWTAECVTELGFPASNLPWESEEPAAIDAVAECIKGAQLMFDVGALSFGFDGDGKVP